MLKKTEIHPGFALAWSVREQQMNTDIENTSNQIKLSALEWFKENILKIGYPEIYHNPAPAQIERTPDGKMFINQEVPDPEPEPESSEPPSALIRPEPDV